MTRYPLKVSALFLFAVGVAATVDGNASEVAARDVASLELRLQDELGVSVKELDMMQDRLVAYTEAHGEADAMVAAVKSALDADCWGACLGAVADGMATAVDAGMRDHHAAHHVAHALKSLRSTREAAGERWTDVRYGQALSVAMYTTLVRWSVDHGSYCPGA